MADATLALAWLILMNVLCLCYWCRARAGAVPLPLALQGVTRLALLLLAARRPRIAPAHHRGLRLRQRD